MPKPASNDPINPDAIGGSEQSVHLASLAIRWFALAALALTIALFYVVSASAGELVGLVAKVADGDTLTILDAGRHQIRIRLADIDAPEKRQAFGTRSRQSLAELCAGKVATVEDRGTDRYGRTIGRVMCSGIDANAEQVSRGMAWVYQRYASPTSALYRLEADAREARRGLWRDKNPVAPWEWRRMARRRK